MKNELKSTTEGPRSKSPSKASKDTENKNVRKYKGLLTPTMLIPLWARAVDAESKDAILGDQTALPILRQLGYDTNYLSPRKQNASLVGCCIRALWIDQKTLEFVRSHPGCQVINLGAGLDDRFRRIGYPKEVDHWYDLDLPEVAEMRQSIIKPAERNDLLSMDMLEGEWMEHCVRRGTPTLIILEGVSMYFEEKVIKDLFDRCVDYFGKVTILFDAVADKMVHQARHHDSVQKHGNKDVEYLWSATNEAYLQGLFHSMTKLEMVRMSDLPGARKFHWLLRFLYHFPSMYKHFNQLLISMDLESIPSKGV